jgi:Cytosolic domain of 10TM putative phosphate transporter
MKKRLEEVFYQMFSPEKVVSVRVIPKMDDLLERGERLKVHKNKLAYYKQKLEETGIRSKIKRGGCCWCGRIEVDAIDYFTMNIERDTEYIRREKGNRANCNSGMAVVTFISRL